MIRYFVLLVCIVSMITGVQAQLTEQQKGKLRAHDCLDVKLVLDQDQFTKYVEYPLPNERVYTIVEMVVQPSGSLLVFECNNLQPEVVIIAPQLATRSLIEGRVTRADFARLRDYIETQWHGHRYRQMIADNGDFVVLIGLKQSATPSQVLTLLQSFVVSRASVTLLADHIHLDALSQLKVPIQTVTPSCQ